MPQLTYHDGAPDPAQDGAVKMLKGLLPPGHSLALIVINDETREFSVTHDCGVRKLQAVARALAGERP